MAGGVVSVRTETIGDCVLHLGDCREILPTLMGVDAVISDPPYGISHSSNHGASWQGTTIASDQDTSARDFVVQWLGKRPGVFFGTWKTPPPVGVRGCLVWDKGPAFGMGDLSFPWKPSFELAYVLGEGWAGSRHEGVLRGPVVVSWESAGRVHPHQKPEWLAEHFLQRLPASHITCDPFMGSGSTALGCVNLNRRFIGCEIEPRYFDIACRRIEAAYRQPRLFDEPLPKPVQASLLEAAE